MLQHQWENPIVLAVERWLKTCLLKDQIRLGAVGLGKFDANESIAEINSYYYHTKFDHSLQSSMMDREKYLQSHELLKRLAKIAHKQMDPKPSLQEIEQALSALLSHQLDVPHKTRPGEKRKMPAMAFSREGEVMVAEHLVKHYDKARLKSCLRDVLSHEHAKKKNILYGRCDERLPYLWSVMNIEAKAGVRLLMERPSYFSPEIIESTRNVLKKVGYSSKGEGDPHGLQPIDVSKDSFGSYFSDTAHKEVDMDLDEYAARKHVHKIGLAYLYDAPPSDAQRWDVSPSAFTEAEMKAMGARRLLKLKSYPRNIPERNRFECQAAITKDKHDNPRKYSLRAHCESFVGKKRKADAAGMLGGEEEEEEKENVAAAAARYDTEMKDAEEEEKNDELLYNPQNFCDDAEFSDGEEEEDARAAVPSQSQNNHNWSAFGGAAAAGGIGGGAGAAAAAASSSNSYYGDGQQLTDEEWARAAAGDF